MMESGYLIYPIWNSNYQLVFAYRAVLNSQDTEKFVVDYEAVGEVPVSKSNRPLAK